jgi:DNA polymerase elongation subunit (family B)
MINSLYGRMGMNNLDNYSFFIKEEDLDKYLNLDILSIKKINNMVLLNVEINNKIKDFNIKIKKDIKKNISIASAITSKSRIKLYRAQKEVIKNNGRILYSDTDSIFASFNRDVSNEKHGEIF